MTRRQRIRWSWPFRLVGIALAALLAFPMLPMTMTTMTVMAQQPPEFDLALADLSRRVGRTLTLADFNNATSRWEWRGVDYKDSALECPAPGEAVTPGIFSGYQFIFVLRRRAYDYRVVFGRPETLRLCTNPNAGAQYELPPQATVEPRTEPPPEFALALADLNARLELQLTLDDFNTPRSRWSWRWREYRNSQLECPRAGQRTDQVVTGGWQFIFVYEGRTFDYRVANNNPSSLFLCRGG